MPRSRSLALLVIALAALAGCPKKSAPADSGTANEVPAGGYLLEDVTTGEPLVYVHPSERDVNIAASIEEDEATLAVARLWVAVALGWEPEEGAALEPVLAGVLLFADDRLGLDFASRVGVSRDQAHPAMRDPADAEAMLALLLDSRDPIPELGLRRRSTSVAGDIPRRVAMVLGAHEDDPAGASAALKALLKEPELDQREVWFAWSSLAHLAETPEDELAASRGLLAELEGVDQSAHYIADLDVFDVRQEVLVRTGVLRLQLEPDAATDAATAIDVSTVRDEYRILAQTPCGPAADAGWELVEQALIEVEGSSYDVLSMRCTDGGAERDFWFDVGLWLSIMNGTMGGAELPPGMSRERAGRVLMEQLQR